MRGVPYDQGKIRGAEMSDKTNGEINPRRKWVRRLLRVNPGVFLGGLFLVYIGTQDIFAGNTGWWPLVGGIYLGCLMIGGVIGITIDRWEEPV